MRLTGSIVSITSPNYSQASQSVENIADTRESINGGHSKLAIPRNTMQQSKKSAFAHIHDSTDIRI